MSARTPRRSFATPFVVTLAGTAACYVQTGSSSGPSSPPPQVASGPSSQPPPSQPPPSQPPVAQNDPSTPPPVIVNPPRPETQPTRPDPRPSAPPPTRPDPRPSAPPTQTKPPVVVNPPMPNDPRTQTAPTPATPTPATQTSVSQWTVYKAKNGCMAAIKVECQPKATCNPPPPFKVACYDNVSLEKPVTVTSRDGGTTCSIEHEMPSCPPGAACNPPRPTSVTCPKR